MEELLNKACDFNQDVYRNIVSLRHAEALFDDLTEGDEAANQAAIAAEMRVKADLPVGIIERGFQYTTAIGYPFAHEPWLASRYSDGSFPVWYGCLEYKTTIYETAYHMLRAEMGVEGIAETVVRERAVYKVHCHALLIDLLEKEAGCPGLVAESYELTQRLGKRLCQEGHPGLLAPSARCQGANVIVFQSKVLSDPRVHCYLKYCFDPRRQEIAVERQPGKTLLRLRLTDFARQPATELLAG